MGSVQRAFSGTADLVATNQPWLTSPLLMEVGFFWGFQRGTARPAYWDVQDLKQKGYIKNTSVRIAADVAGGKTTLGKSVLHGAAGLQAGTGSGQAFRRSRGLVHDRDLEGSHGEYKRLCDELLGRNVRLADFGEINLFDPRMCETEADYIRVATEACTDSKESELDPLERLACQVTVHRMMALLPEHRTTDVFETFAGQNNINHLNMYSQGVRDSVMTQVDVLLNEDGGTLTEQLTHGHPEAEHERVIAEYRAQFVTDPHIVHDPVQQQSFREASTRVSTYMGNILRGGAYGTMFGNKTSPYDLLTDPFTVLDWNGVPVRAANLLETLMHFWIGVGLRRGDNTVTPDYMVSDEEGSELKNARHAALRAEIGRKSRKRRTVDISQQQYVTDCLTVGDAGSALRQWGKVIHDTTGLWLIGNQPSDDDTLDVITRLGVSDLNAYRTTQLEQGSWAVIFPGVGVDFIQHYVLPSQRPFVLSDRESRAAAERSRVSDDPIIQERLRTLNTIP